MHRDTKLGLALGVLLVGIVGAFFFRNEPIPAPDVPELRTAESIDAQIADQPHAPYITGFEPVDAPQRVIATETPGTRPQPPRWDIPEFLKQDFEGPDPFDPASLAGAPDPIRPTENPPSSPIPIPPHNRAWTPEPGSRLTVARPIASTRPVADERIADERIHVVASGDTLSGLAVKYLGSVARFGELFEANRDQLRSPDDLRVGMKLRIPAANTSREAHSDGPAQPATVSPISTDIQILPPETGPASEPKVRFQAVSRTPFSPRPRMPLSEPAGTETERPAPRSLSQSPPIDIPGLKGDSLADVPAAGVKP